MKKTNFFIKSVLLIVFLLIYNPIFANPKVCSLNGQWFDMNSGLPMFKLKQKGSRVTIGEKIVHPICGEYLIEGVIVGDKFNFKFSMSQKEEEFCRSWTNVVGEFTSPNCDKIRGESTSHVEINSLPVESTMPFTWFLSIIKIISPDPVKVLIITAEPKMPEFKAEAMLDKPDALHYLSGMFGVDYNAPPFAWNVRMKHSPISGRLDFDIILDEVATNDKTYIPNFNLLKSFEKGELVDGGVMGGELTLSVDYYKAVSDEKKYIIKGTNPGKVAIERVLTDSISQHIACQESRYKQFIADREGGVGFPVIGKNDEGEAKGGIGIMQICNPPPTAAQVWNWRKNIEVALVLLAKKREEALKLPKTELNRLNKERAKMKLPLCESLPSLTESQVQRETLRRYNNGREHRWEPRDDPNCKGKWIIRPTLPKGSDPDYVENAMACKF